MTTSALPHANPLRYCSPLNPNSNRNYQNFTETHNTENWEDVGDSIANYETGLCRESLICVLGAAITRAELRGPALFLSD